jgi:hypothetical protein
LLAAFLDDSHHSNGKIFAFGGIVLDMDQIGGVEEAFRELLRPHDVPLDVPGLDVEIKMSPKRTNWLRGNIGDVDRHELWCGILGLIDAFAIHPIVAGSWYGRIAGQSQEAARSGSISHSFRQVDAVAASQGTRAMLFCDQESDPRTTRARVLDSLEMIRSEATVDRLVNIYGPIFPVDSSHHLMSQIADLVVGTTAGMMLSGNRYVTPMWHRVAGRFRMYGVQGERVSGLALSPPALRRGFVTNHHPFTLPHLVPPRNVAAQS